MCHTNTYYRYMWGQTLKFYLHLFGFPLCTPSVWCFNLEDDSRWPCLALPSVFSSIPSSLSLSLSPVSSLFTPGLYSWLFVYCFCFPKSRPPSLPLFPLSCCTIYHSLPPSHLSLCLLPSLCLSLLRFSSGSPLIKPLCLLPPCPVSTHTSHTSLSRFLSLISVLLSLSIFLSRPYASFLTLVIQFLLLCGYFLLWGDVSYLDWF